VGAAVDGEQVIAMAKKLNPDVITMDLQMPKINGLAATRHIMDNGRPSPIVVMLSAFNKEDAGTIFDCLSSGAFDCVRKPSGTLSLDIDAVGADLIAKVKAAAQARTDVLKQTTERERTRQKTQSTAQPAATPGRSVIVIGASTGGPPVIEEILSLLKEPLPAIVLIAQHMPEPFTASFAERLDRISPMPVREAEDGQIIQSGMVILARGDGDLSVSMDAQGKLQTHFTAATLKNELHPSIDLLMESVAKVYGNNAIGVLMTGMGNDGTAGMRAIHKHGGHTLVQSPTTCVVDSMVQSVIDEGCADEQLTPHTLATRLRTLATA
jgi:two-component system chemotaxis response regulator CheB